jgi:hypothetical protein
MNGEGKVPLMKHILSWVLLCNFGLANTLVQALLKKSPKYATEYPIQQSPIFELWKTSIAENTFKNWLLSPEPFPKIGKCLLSKEETVSRLSSSFQQLSIQVSNLFQTIDRVHQNELEDVELSQFDLWHGHVILSNTTLGIVFHTKEYPKQTDEFPYNLGFCQQKSNVTNINMSLRNWVWLYDTSARLFRIDANVKDIGSEFLPEAPFYTLDALALGTIKSDVYYFNDLSWSLY